MDEKNNRSVLSGSRPEYRRHGNPTPGGTKRSSRIRVLDYLPQGKGTSGRPGNPLLQGIDENDLSLLEIYPLEGVIPAIGAGVTPGDGVGRVKGRISYDELSRGAQLELPVVLEEIIREQEATFIRFFNEPKPIGLRLNSLNLLPGIGEKHMWEIINGGEKQPFSGFADLRQRIPTLSDPEKSLMTRIIQEMKGGEKYYFFVMPPKKRV